ncbi:MAG: hypothetical protein ACJ8DZ_13760 [Allosphingosinicella sp.]
MRATEARIAGPGHCVSDPPELDGIACEVQHSFGKGEFTNERGTFGCGVLVLPTGQPRVVVQIKHADGSCLGATLKDAIDITTVVSCLLDAAREAQRIADQADAAKARPS